MKKNRTGATATAATPPPRRWRFTADQYQEMGKAGIFHAEDRVELLEGDLYEMPPMGDWHNGSNDIAAKRFMIGLGDRAIVRVQGSFRLTSYSEPEPDILVLRFRPDFYRTAPAGPEDVLLLIEVSDSSLSHDRDFKLPLYARAGIAEVWIVNRGDARIERYRDPKGGAYQTVSRHERGNSLAPAAFPDLAISVDEILG